MARLNFASRTMGGHPLGCIVAEHLRRKFLGNPNPRTLTKPIIELDLSNDKLNHKGLTDQGFAEFIDTLIECFEAKDAEHPNGIFQLVKLQLSRNELTIRSLPKLTRVIELSVGSLSELDLSNNLIQVETDKQKRIWERFLDPFKNCTMLKKLHLGGNPLGTFGMEILAKKYVRNPLVSASGQDDLRPSGLQSIPYLILPDMTLTPCAMVHLSSMLSTQCRRDYLRKFLPDTKPVPTPDEALAACWSIIWLPNENLSAAKRDFLDCATTMAPRHDDESETSCGRGGRTLRSPTPNAMSAQHAVRAQYQDSRPDEYFWRKSELSIQAVQEWGVGCSDLWDAAVKMLKACKILLIELDCAKLEQHAVQNSYCQDARSKSQMLLDQFPSVIQGKVNQVIRTLRGIPCEVSEDKQCHIIAKAVRADKLLTGDQQMQIMEYAKTWTFSGGLTGEEQSRRLVEFLVEVNCLTYRFETTRR